VSHLRADAFACVPTFFETMVSTIDPAQHGTGRDGRLLECQGRQASMLPFDAQGRLATCRQQILTPALQEHQAVGISLPIEYLVGNARE